MSIEAPVQGIGPRKGTFTCVVITGDTVNSTRYCPIGFSSSAPYTATEALASQPINFNFMVTEVRARMNQNAKNASTVIGFRDDGVTVGSITITAGTQTWQTASNVNTVVASGSLCDFIIDTVASASGASGAVFVYVDYIVL